jgi:hypothetical protein
MSLDYLNNFTVGTGLKEATFATLYEAEFFVKRVYEDYPPRGYNTGCKITERDGSWVVIVKRWDTCS